MKILQQDLIKILSDSFIASTKKLNSLFGQKIEVTLENANIIEDIDTISDIFENLVTIQNSFGMGELYTILPASCASPLAELMMSGEITGGQEIGELKENALKELFSQIIDIYSEKMSKELFQPFIFDIKKVLYAKDFKATKALMPSVLQGALIIDYNVSSALIPKEVIRQIVPLEIFNQLLELIMPDIDTTEDFINMQDPNIDESSIMVQPVQFPSFDEQTSMQLEGNKNFNLLLDIKLKLTVELGRAELPIKRVLELTRGSIIELDKIAGEPVELYANNKLVARGEVVVIEDNFGLRITNIISPDDRIKNL